MGPLGSCKALRPKALISSGKKVKQQPETHLSNLCPETFPACQDGLQESGHRSRPSMVNEGKIKQLTSTPTYYSLYRISTRMSIRQEARNILRGAVWKASAPGGRTLDILMRVPSGGPPRDHPVPPTVTVPPKAVTLHLRHPSRGRVKVVVLITLAQKAATCPHLTCVSRIETMEWFPTCCGHFKSIMGKDTRGWLIII